MALVVKSEDALAPLMNTVAQPVLLLSGILLPLTFAPGWLQGIADWNPFSWAVERHAGAVPRRPGRPGRLAGPADHGGAGRAGGALGGPEFARSVR